MRYFSVYLITFLVIIISLLSCRPKEKPSLDNGITFDTLHSVRNYHLENDSTKPSCNLKLSFVYPVSYKDEAVLDSLQDIFVRCFFNESYSGLDPAKAVKSYENDYVESYKEDARIFSRDRTEHDTSEMYSSYYEIDNNAVTFNQGGILSFQISQTNYKGGASSYEFMTNYSVDIKNVRLLTEEDIFVEGFEIPLGTLFREYLMRVKGVKNVSELENLGYFGLEEISPNGNFLLDDKAITYVFNKGEYSGYKTDAITISVPYKDIRPLLKEGSVISKFISY